MNPSILALLVAACVTVLAGAMQRRAEGIEETFWPSQTWVEPGVPHAAGNRAQAPASVGVAFLVPKGHGLTHVVEEPRARDGLGLPTEAWATRAAFMMSRCFSSFSS